VSGNVGCSVGGFCSGSNSVVTHQRLNGSGYVFRHELLLLLLLLLLLFFLGARVTKSFVYRLCVSLFRCEKCVVAAVFVGRCDGGVETSERRPRIDLLYG
jgi:hypothetical protein